MFFLNIQSIFWKSFYKSTKYIKLLDAQKPRFLKKQISILKKQFQIFFRNHQQILLEEKSKLFKVQAELQLQLLIRHQKFHLSFLYFQLYFSYFRFLSSVICAESPLKEKKNYGIQENTRKTYQDFPSRPRFRVSVGLEKSCDINQNNCF